MGTMIDLRVGNLVADWGKNEFYRDHRSLFQKEDVRKVLAGQDPGGQDGMINTLSRPLRDVVPRLHLLGYTMESARAEYNNLLELHVDDDSTYPTFDAFSAALCAIDIGDVSADYEDDHSFGEFFREEIGPRIDVNSLFKEPHSGQWEYATMMENFHPWHVLILLAQEPTNLALPVVWDYFAHMENGWSEPEDFVPNLKPEERILIVTEGSSDSKVLQKAFAMFQPAIVDFFTFIDMEEGYPFSGSGNLATFCRGLAKIHIQNKTLALFDNDAEGVSVESSLSLADLSKRALVTADFRRTHPALHQWLNEQCLATGFRPAFVEEVTSTQEATDLVQEGVGIALLPEGVCRNDTQDVCVIPIRDLKPLELVLVYRSNCSPIAEKIAIGIADSIRSDELARTG